MPRNLPKVNASFLSNLPNDKPDTDTHDEFAFLARSPIKGDERLNELELRQSADDLVTNWDDGGTPATNTADQHEPLDDAVYEQGTPEPLDANAITNHALDDAFPAPDNPHGNIDAQEDIADQHATIMPDDTSEPIPHTVQTGISKFEAALALWCENASISRTQYSSLRTVLQTIEDTSQIEQLPKRLDTLKSRFRDSLPLAKMRRKKIQLDSTKIPSRMSTEGTVYFFEPIKLFETLLRTTDICTQMYFGMAQLVDRPSELWHSKAWGSSVRTTSGRFMRYPDGSPLLPSDFVQYKRLDDSTTHIGQVYWVGEDRRSTQANQGQQLALLRPLVEWDGFTETLRRRMAYSVEPPQNAIEVFLVEDTCVEVLECHGADAL